MAEKLTKPNVELFGDTLHIEESSGRAAYFDILVNGIKKATIYNSNFILVNGQVFRLADEQILNIKE